MNIYDIKEQTKETSPYFFSEDTLRFFGQQMSHFTVDKIDDRFYKIFAPIIDHRNKHVSDTIRFFDNETKELLSEEQFNKIKEGN